LTTEVVGGASRITPGRSGPALVADGLGLGPFVVKPGPTPASGWARGTTWLRPGREIKDSGDRPVLRRLHDPVGQLKITQADDDSATGTLTGLRRRSGTASVPLPGEYAVGVMAAGQLSSGRPGALLAPPFLL